MINDRSLADSLKAFLKLETAGGLLLMGAAALAMIAENVPFTKLLYDALLSTPVELHIGALHLAKPLLLWINDGLMAVFFFLVGLELKRELLEGELSRPGQITLPAFAAFGGMLVPALFYVAINWEDAQALNGWAIPAATDIAFALGVLALLGDRVPPSLKLFLLSLAIIDDIGAIIIIAIFYSADLSLDSLLFSAVVLVVLTIMNRTGVKRLGAYLLLGVVLWISVLKSGVHATLAGVALAFFIPMQDIDDHGQSFSPVKRIEHDLHPAVAFGILPLFAFANAGVSLSGLTLSSLLQPIPLGIVLGLFLGKQIGVFCFSWLAIKLRLAKLPNDASWSQVYGISLLCGIGFTMSLFIGSLAFEHGGPDYVIDARLGIITGTLLSALGGYFLLRFTSSRGSPSPRR